MDAFHPPQICILLFLHLFFYSLFSYFYLGKGFPHCGFPKPQPPLQSSTCQTLYLGHYDNLETEELQCYLNCKEDKQLNNLPPGK